MISVFDILGLCSLSYSSKVIMAYDSRIRVLCKSIIHPIKSNQFFAQDYVKGLIMNSVLPGKNLKRFLEAPLISAE